MNSFVNNAPTDYVDDLLYDYYWDNPVQLYVLQPKLVGQLTQDELINLIATGVENGMGGQP